MATPGSSGAGGLSSIPDDAEQGFVGEQVQPTFASGGYQLRLGDRVTAWHRVRKLVVSGVVTKAYSSPVLLTIRGEMYPLTLLQIREVQPPMPYDE